MTTNKADDIDAEIDVLTENISACQAGKPGDELGVAMGAERDAISRVSNVIAVWGVGPVLLALKLWCCREQDKDIGDLCDRLDSAFKAARHPMLYRECEDDGNDTPPAPEPHAKTIAFHCPRCGKCDWDLMVTGDDAGEHTYQTCQSCGYRWVQT